MLSLRLKSSVKSPLGIFVGKDQTIGYFVFMEKQHNILILPSVKLRIFRYPNVLKCKNDFAL